MAIQKDGYQTTISFSALSSGIVFNVVAKEKGITPPAIEGGGKIDLTTMRNSNVRTFYPKQLYTLGDSSVVVASSSASNNSCLVESPGLSLQVPATIPANNFINSS